MIEKFTIDRKKLLEICYAGGLGCVAIFFQDKPIWIQAVLDWLQLSLIFILYLIILNDENTCPEISSGSKKAFAQFRKYWKNLWRVWLALYLIFAINNTFRAIHSNSLNGESAFKTGNIVSLPKFAAKLTSNNNPVSVYLFNSLRTATQTKLNDYTKKHPGFDQQLAEVLVDELNAVVESTNIYEKDRFNDVTLSPECKQLLSPDLARPKDAATDIPRLNRLLIENTYPEELSGDPLNVPFWKSSFNLIANTINNIQSFYIFLLFLVMSKKTTGETNNPIQYYSQVIIILIIVFSLAELAFSVLAPMLFNFVNDRNADAISRVAGIGFSTFSGLFAGVAFCLFFGRLGSHYIGMSSFYMSALFLYATIQPLYPLFRIFDTNSQGDTETIQICLKILAAVLKLTLFLRVRAIIKNSRLLFFMSRVGDDSKTMDKQFDDFLLAQRPPIESETVGGS